MTDGRAWNFSQDLPDIMLDICEKKIETRVNANGQTAFLSHVDFI